MGENILMGIRGFSCRPAVLGAGFAAAMFFAGIPMSGMTAASAATYEISPEADTYILESSGGTNYGTDANLAVRSHQGGPNHHNKRSLLRFNLASLAGCDLSSAKLRLTAYDINGNAVGRAYNLHFVENDTWLETGVTWNTAPAHDGNLDIQVRPRHFRSSEEEKMPAASLWRSRLGAEQYRGFNGACCRSGPSE